MQDAARFNMDPHSLALLADALTETMEADDGVWPENAAIVDAFLAVASQWRVISVGGGMAPAMPFYVGQDYAAARVALDAEAIPVTPDLWRGLRIMETAACNALNEADR